MNQAMNNENVNDFLFQLSKRSPHEIFVMLLNNYSKLCYFFHILQELKAELER